MISEAMLSIHEKVRHVEFTSYASNVTVRRMVV
jgi:hypothetical protein